MLVLTRKPGQRIHIGNDIVLTVLAIEGDRVRVGIAAPRDVQVLRGELLDEVASVNRGAARPAGPVGAALLSELGKYLSKGPKPGVDASED
jgi:carbon storage regulator